MISYLQIEELTKSFGDLVLFENLSFGISEGDRIGLIAKNGTGKTTLLNIIAGKEDYDSGNVTFRRDLRVGYLEQMPVYPPELTVIQACFHSQNETVQVISQYEQIMMSDDHSRLEEVLEHRSEETEKEINRLAFKLYDLSPAEINYITDFVTQSQQSQ